MNKLPMILTTHTTYSTCFKGKAIPLQAGRGPEDSRGVEASIFQDNWHMKVVRSSALHTSRLYPPRNIPGIHFC